jgi:hypothetical protein
LKKQPKLDALSLIHVAEGYSVIGEKTDAFEALEVAYQDHVTLMIFLDTLPNFRNIRSGPRYSALLRRMKLPQSAMLRFGSMPSRCVLTNPRALKSQPWLWFQGSAERRFVVRGVGLGKTWEARHFKLA